MWRKQGWMLCMLCLICCVLTGCAAQQSSRQPADIVFEPEANEKSKPLSSAEVAALKSSGEIDHDLPSTAMADVTREFKYYVQQARGHIKATVKRSEKYLPYAREVFRDSGMPEDLAYLAIVESGYRTDAVSRVGAAGAWQFMDKTGKQYGLDQDGWTDDRFDLYEATEAAASYLSALYKRFQDWPTAIAAYNAGGGKMSRAMAASGSKNFFEVRERNDTLPEELKLRDETKQYVPRFLAITKIMRNLDSLGFPTLNQAQNFRVKRIDAKPGTDLKSLAKAIDVPWAEFCFLNRHHKGQVSSATRETYIYVPAEKVPLARKLLADGHSGSYTGWRVCSLDGKKQTWSGLSKKYRVSQEHLKAANPGCSLRTGELVFLPGSIVTQHAKSKYEAQQTVHSSTRRTHRVQANETLYAVARKYGVAPSGLLHVNKISDPSRVAVGTVLIVPVQSQERHVAYNQPLHGSYTGSLGHKEKKTYVVQPHDTLWGIAKRNHVSVEDLKRWNNVNETSLQTGLHLTVSR